MQPSRAESLGAAGVALAQTLMFGWATFGSPPYAFYAVLKWSSILAALYVGLVIFRQSKALAPVSFVLLCLALLHVTASMRKEEWLPFNAAGSVAFGVACLILAVQAPPNMRFDSLLSANPEESALERRLEAAKARETLFHRFSLGASVLALVASGAYSFFVPPTRAPDEVLRYAEVRGGAILEATSAVELLLKEFSASTVYSDESEGAGVLDSLATYKRLSEREGAIVTLAGSTLIGFDALLDRHAADSPSAARQHHGVPSDYQSVREWLSRLRDQVRIVRDDLQQSIRSQDLDPILEAHSSLHDAINSKPAFSVPPASYDQYVTKRASGSPAQESSSVSWLGLVAFSLLPLALLAIPPWPWFLLWLAADDQRFHFITGLYWYGSSLEPYERVMSGVWYLLRLLGCVTFWVVSGALLRHFLNVAATPDAVAYNGLPAAPFAVLAIGLIWVGADTFRYGTAPSPEGLDSSLDGPLILVSVLSLVGSFFLIAPA